MIVHPSLPPALKGVDRATMTESVRRMLLHRVPRNNEELYYYLGRIHGMWLSRHGCCDEHVGSLEFIADAFFQRYLRMLAMAAKGTGKTQDLALLHVANSRFKPGCWTAHMGATMQQADRCYAYFVSEISKQDFASEIEGQPIKKETKFKVQVADGIMAPGSKVEILTGTIAQASGPHEQIGAADEFDQLDWDVWQHFNKTPHEAHGIKPQLILASTRFDANGSVNRVIEELGDKLKVYPWCVLDVMQRCEYDCDNVPGFGKCPLYSRKIVKPGGEVEEEIMCGGRAHNSDGHLTYDEVVGQFLVSDQESYGTLQLLREPGRAGSFFYEADQVLHRKDEYVYVPGRPVYLGFDDGFTFPLCLGAWQLDEQTGVLYQFDEIYCVKKLTSEICLELAEKPWLRDVLIGWPDPNGRQAIEEFRRFFLKALGRPVMVWDTDNSRVDGWKAVRRRLRGPRGEVTLGFNRTACPNSWNDLSGLKRKEGTEDCDKKQDHGADQVRYLVFNLDKYLGLWEARNEDNRRDGQIEAASRAREVAAEAQVQEHWNRLRGLGIPEANLRTVEARYKGERAELARALASWVVDTTLQGRLQRAGLAGPSPEDDDKAFED